MLDQESGGEVTEQAVPADTGSSDIGADRSSLEDAGRQLAESREASETPQGTEVVELKHRDEHGRVTRERADPRERLTREEAAKGLAAYRQQAADTREREQEGLVRQHADALRSGIEQQRQPGDVQGEPRNLSAYQSWHADVRAYDAQLTEIAKDSTTRASVRATMSQVALRMQELNTQLGTAYAEGWDTTALANEYEHTAAALEQIYFVDRAQNLIAQGLSPRVATALADSETLSFIKTTTDAYENAYRAVVAQHESNCMTLIGKLHNVLLWLFPEMTQSDDIQAVINTVRISNPSRADNIARWYAEFEHAIEITKQAHQRHELEKSQQLQEFKDREAYAFRAAHPEFHSVDLQVAAANGVMEMLIDLGMAKDEVTKLYNENELFNSRIGQEILLRAYKNWRAGHTVASKKQPASATQTFKPGVSGSVGREPERMPAVFEGRSGMMAAARILDARRSKRR